MTNSEALLKFGIQGPNPHWSSESLRQFVRDVVIGGSLTDAMIALVVLLGKSDRALSADVAHFIKDFVVLCFTEHRHAFDMVGWDRMAESLGACGTQPLCYFAALAVPPEHLTTAQVSVIINELDNTPYRQETAALAAP